MRNLILLTSFICLLPIYLFSQIRLDVEGDAKIIGKMELSKTLLDWSLYIGVNAGAMDGGSNANTFVGANAGRSNTIGKANTFVGYDAGITNTNSQFNSFFGYYAGRESEGFSNSFFGAYAGQYNDGSSNSFFGRNAGDDNISGSSNSFFGSSAGTGNTTGDYNSFFGAEAGRYNVKGRQNTFLGWRSGHASSIDSLFSAIAIGYNAQVSCHNCAVIGGTGNNAVNLGIGTREPDDRIHLYEPGKASIKLNTTSSGITSLKLYESGEFGFEIMNLGSTNRLFIHAFANGTLTPMASWERNGDFANFGDAEISGDLQVNGTFINSDKRFKKQIRQIVNPMSSLKRLKGVSYAFKNKAFANRNFSEGRTLGLIAQEVEKVFPLLVKEDETGYKSVNYDGFIPVLIEATKAQQELIDQQQAKNTTLQTAVNQQKQQLAAQQQQIDDLSEKLEQLLAKPPTPDGTTNYLLPLQQKASLGQNQPNPFNGRTLIDYFLPENTQNASIRVMALDGKILGEVKNLATGKGQVDIQAVAYPAGTYYYTLWVDGQVVETKKMILTR